MFITVETTDGGEATINIAFVTHITQLESAYAEAGSCVHFSSGRALEIKPTLAKIRESLDPHEGSAETADFLLVRR